MDYISTIQYVISIESCILEMNALIVGIALIVLEFSWMIEQHVTVILCGFKSGSDSGQLQSMMPSDLMRIQLL